MPLCVRFREGKEGDRWNRTTDYTGILLVDCYNQSVSEGVVKALKANASDADSVPCVLCPPLLSALRREGGGGNDQAVFAIGNGQADQTGLHEICGALNCMHDAQALITIDRAAFNQGANAKYDFDIDDSGIAQTIVARGPGAVCDIRKLLPIRRFTPTECARLQGMPSWWCADIPHGDTAEYKMWGNGMALPNALYVMEGFIETKEANND